MLSQITTVLCALSLDWPVRARRRRAPAARLLASFGVVVALSLAMTSAASASSGLTRKLWILNQQGAPDLSDFFQCVLGGTNWNDLANTYSAGETLVWGGMVQRNDNPCTANVGSAAFYQCAVDAGHFDVTPYDVLLVVYPDSGYGGQNGTATVTNPVGGASVVINTAHVTTSPDPIYQTIYGGHEVFEAQTDGVSADCCDGETATGGPMNWCGQCGPFANGTGACGQYAPGGTIGTLGIDTIACPNATYHYQRVSPANHEFDGTCTAIAPLTGTANPCGGVSSANSGVYCGTSTQNGFADGTAGTLYDCRDGFTVSTQACPYGCFIAPAGRADGCNPVPDAGSDAGAHDASIPDAGAHADAGQDAQASDAALAADTQPASGDAAVGGDALSGASEGGDAAPAPSTGGCSCSAPGAASASGFAVWSWLGVMAVVGLARRPRAVRRNPDWEVTCWPDALSRPDLHRGHGRLARRLRRVRRPGPGRTGGRRGRRQQQRRR